jgi:hypothetical protein
VLIKKSKMLDCAERHKKSKLVCADQQIGLLAGGDEMSSGLA